MIQFENLSFSYGVSPVFNHINLTVRNRDHIGLVGRNGSGKSTLLKLLFSPGEYIFETGNIAVGNDWTIGYLEQDFKVSKDTTLRKLYLDVFEGLFAIEEEMRNLEKELAIKTGEHAILLKRYSNLQEQYDEANGYAIDSRIRGIARGLSFSNEKLDQPFTSLSGGEKTRGVLGKILLENPDLLLLDEPTNYLDLETIQWLEQYLASYKGAYIVISHDRFFLDRVAKQIWHINSQYGIDVYKGDYTEFTKQRKLREQQQFHQYKEQQKEINRQKDIIRRYQDINSIQSSKKAHSREKALNKIDVIDSPVHEQDARFSFTPKIKSGKIVLTVEGLGKAYNNQPLFDNVTFEVVRRDKVGIIGPNGVGKTTLFRILMGQEVQSSGEFHIGHHVHFGYFDQEHRDLDSLMDMNLIEALWDIDIHYSEGDLRNMLAQFLFTDEDVFKKISSLSGGERSRIVLARLMMTNANVLIFDEPTNHLDITTKEILENALNAYEGTAIFISHDRYFLNEVANRIFVFKPEGIESYLGNYNDYLKAQERQDEIEALKNKPVVMNKTREKAARKAKKEQENYLRSKKKKLISLENEIILLEDKTAKTEALMCAENFFDDRDHAAKITEEYEHTKIELDKIMDEWADLSVEIEALQESQS